MSRQRAHAQRHALSAFAKATPGFNKALEYIARSGKMALSRHGSSERALAMIKVFRIAFGVVALLSLATPCLAVDAASVPEAKRTTLGLYLTSEEVPPFLAERGGHSLFVDVRAPEELAATGVATLVDANAPLFLLSGGDGKPRPNLDFVTQVEGRLAAKGLAKTDVVVVMCRTGRRSAAAANLLAEAGFSRVYSVVDGFEGDGAGAGWKSKGLPWRQAGASDLPK